MIRLLTIALCAVLASCASKHAPSSIVPPAPPRAVPVAPEVSKLRDQITAADKSVAVIAAGAKEAARAATAARQEAERLKIQKSATEAELTKLWHDLQTVEARNFFLETETSRLAVNLTDARATAAKLQEHAAAKDAEAERLRGDLDFLSIVAKDHANSRSEAEKATAKERTRADKLAGEIRLYRIALGICGAIALAWVAAKIFLPPRILS
jgi:chromosome segregation ATPase